jgi:hypothetical protein
MAAPFACRARRRHRQRRPAGAELPTVSHQTGSGVLWLGKTVTLEAKLPADAKDEVVFDAAVGFTGCGLRRRCPDTSSTICGSSEDPGGAGAALRLHELRVMRSLSPMRQVLVLVLVAQAQRGRQRPRRPWRSPWCPWGWR